METFDNFIKKNLQKIFNDFQLELSSMKDLCVLKGFHFGFGNIPDYRMKIIQQYYLLRYLPLYLYEYYHIYNNLIIEKFIENNDYKICSVGSGCGLDFYGFYWAMKNNNLIAEANNYLGVDKCQWYDVDFMEGTKMNILINNITQYSSFNDIFNVYIFPKSLNEFRNIEFKLLKQLFVNSNFNQKKIILISSGISSIIDFETTKFADICQIILSKGYKTDDTINQYFYLVPGFNIKYLYDVGIINFLTSLSQYCTSSKMPSCDLGCTQVINKYPIYSSEYIKFNVVKFEKIL